MENEKLAFESQLKKSFAKVDEARGGSYRCERLLQGRPASTYYFIKSGQLPETGKDLLKFQDDLLGVDFFRASGALQWNYYLVFIAPTESFQNPLFLHKKTVVEQDRNYARKYVIAEEELDRFLGFTAERAGAPRTHDGDVVSRWLTKLDAVGLGAIHSKQNRTEVIRDIIAGKFSPRIDGARPAALTQDHVLKKRIDELKIENFRPYPVKKDFRFGLVNLIFGRNGVGKTSLLEAIEHFYCGGTKRHTCLPDEAFKVSVRFLGETNFVDYVGHENRFYQAREKEWYGKIIPRGNPLPLSFGQYNFFNSDAAYELEKRAQSDDQILADAFSDIALGVEANTLWQRIADFESDLRKEISSHETQSTQAIARLSADQRMLDEYQNALPRSEALLSDLKANLSILKWRNLPGSLEQAKSTLFLDWTPFILEARKLKRVDSKKFDSLAAANLEAVRLRSFENEFRRETFETAEIKRRTSAAQNTSESNKQALKTLRMFREYVSSSFGDFIKKEGDLSSELVTRSAISVPTDDEISLLVGLPEGQGARELESQLKVKAETARVEYKELQAQSLQTERTHRDMSSKLAQMRLAALEVLKSPAFVRDHCPLCETEFDVADLEKKIDIALKQDQDSTGIEQKRIELNERREELSRLENISKQLQSVIRAAIAVEPTLSLDIGVGHLIGVTRAFSERSQEIQEELDYVRKRTAELKRIGFSENEWVRIVDQIGNIPRIAEVLTKPESEIDRILVELENENESAKRLQSQEEESVRNRSEKLVERWRTESGLNADNLEQVRLALEQQLELLEQHVATYRTISRWIDFDENSPTHLLIGQSDQTDALIAEFSSSLSADSTRISSIRELTNRLGVAATQLEELKVAEERLRNAHNVLEAIISKDSKQQALRDFISANRTAINDIFVRIHAPKEFEGLSETGLTLIRKYTKKPASLSELSTGQRAAIALSTFFALNANTTNAPPVILIDDPIAHVDDLNALSFLDFLRDQSVSKQRQVFFATADRKVASLFRQKFAFLGDDFVYEELERPE